MRLRWRIEPSECRPFVCFRWLGSVDADLDECDGSATLAQQLQNEEYERMNRLATLREQRERERAEREQARLEEKANKKKKDCVIM